MNEFQINAFILNVQFLWTMYVKLKIRRKKKFFLSEMKTNDWNYEQCILYLLLRPIRLQLHQDVRNFFHVSVNKLVSGYLWILLLDLVAIELKIKRKVKQYVWWSDFINKHKSYLVRLWFIYLYHCYNLLDYILHAERFAKPSPLKDLLKNLFGCACSRIFFETLKNRQLVKVIFLHEPFV